MDQNPRIERASGENSSIRSVRLLGPIEVLLANGEVVVPPSQAQRRIIAVLGIYAPNTVRVDSLCEICGVTAAALRKTVSRLRKALGDAFRTDALGYGLNAPVDIQQFEHLFRTFDDPSTPSAFGPVSGHITNVPDNGSENRPANERLREIGQAVALWRGEVLAEFHGEPWALPTITRLTELRSAALDDRAALLIVLDRASEAVAEMELQVGREPLRDRSRGLLLRALAASGRQTDALRAYQTYREFLATEAGTEPSHAVRDIERSIATGWDGRSEKGPSHFPSGANADRSSPELSFRERSEPSARHPIITPLPPILANVVDTSLVGRGDEIAKLNREFERGASTQRLRSVLIGGESGIGKTTLAATFAQSLRAQTNAVIAAGRCDDGESVVLKPFREIAGFLVDHAPAALLQEHLSAAGSHLVRLAPNLERRADVVHSGYELSEDFQDPSNDVTARYLLFEAVADLLRRFAAHQRLVVVLDDLQWAEPTTLLLLRHLNRALGDTNILLVVTYRNNEFDEAGTVRAALAELERGQCTRLSLGGLRELDFGTLVGRIVSHHTEPNAMPPVDEQVLSWKTSTLRASTGASSTGASLNSAKSNSAEPPAPGSTHQEPIDALAPQFMKKLFDETAGNPLYTWHLVRQLVETQSTTVGRFGIQLKHPGEVLELPNSIRDVIWSRVSGLGESTAELLSTAAVLGREFRVDLLRSLVDLSDQQFHGGIEAGIRSGILQQDPGVQQPQGLSSLRFTHAVVAHSLYEELTPFKRQRLHARTANTLVLLDPMSQPELVVALARHFTMAGDFTPAMSWCRAAGNQALTNLAPNEAAQWYEKALHHAQALRSEIRGTQEPFSANETSQSHIWTIAELTLQLGKAQRLASNREARATLLKAAELAQEIGSVTMLIQSALANTRGFQQAVDADLERLNVIELALNALDHLSRADNPQAEIQPFTSGEFESLSTVGSLLADEVISIQSNLPSIRARLLALLSQELLHTTEAVRRRATAEESLRIALADPDPSLLVRIAPEVLNALWEPGGAQRCNEIATKAVQTVHLLGEPLLTYRVYTGRFQAAVQIGDHRGAREAWRLAVEAAAIATDPTVRWPLVLKEVYEQTMAGDLAAAETLAEQAYAVGEESGESDAGLIYATQIGSIRASQGRIAEIFPFVEHAALGSPGNLALQLFLAISCLEVGRNEVAQSILTTGADLDFTHVPFDFLWTSSMALYAILAVDLGDVKVARRLLEILEPFASEICFNGATSLGCLSGQVGALASLLGRHDDAERYLLHALAVHRNFGWAFHEASALIGLARARLAKVGILDEVARNWLAEASAIGEAKRLARVHNSVAKMLVTQE
jgi:predicted ATPase/DNA-binding SARP family transcriptional activator